VLRITVGIASDDARPGSPDIARGSEDVDEANMDVLETRVALICGKQLAKLRFFVERWLKDSIEGYRTFGKLAMRERKWVDSLFWDMVGSVVGDKCGMRTGEAIAESLAVFVFRHRH
jgi:hypothetical protein